MRGGAQPVVWTRLFSLRPVEASSRIFQISPFSQTCLILLLVLLGIAGCSKSRGNITAAREPEQESNYKAQPYQGKMEPDDGQWIRPAKDLASTRYSSLDQVNTGNVKTLKLAWTFSTGLLRGHEAAPLVVNNTMYLVTPWPNLLYALDLTQPGAPVKWKFDPGTVPESQGMACCDVVNRGAAF